MEFKFNLNDIFENVISEVNYTLLPVNFSGDRRNAVHVAGQVADIVDAMGIASAKAQDLHHPITSAENMKSLDHTLYLMIDPRDNEGKGSLVGLLKMGEKNLFLFDGTGTVHEMKNLCVLDFYIHETKQRNGFGKVLFDFMLEDKDIVPWKLAIDKPTQTFLSFLEKHYGISKIYPQNNNFVVFEGFFDEKSGVSSSQESIKNPNIYETQVEKGQHFPDKSEQEDCGSNLHGRHSAFKLPDTMEGIIGDHSTHWPAKPSATSTGEHEDYKPDLHGRHEAFKLPDTMEGIIGDGSTHFPKNRSPTRKGLVFVYFGVKALHRVISCMLFVGSVLVNEEAYVYASDLLEELDCNF